MIDLDRIESHKVQALEVKNLSFDELSKSYLDLYEDFTKALEVNRKLINVTGELLSELEVKNNQLKQRLNKQ